MRKMAVLLLIVVFSAVCAPLSIAVLPVDDELCLGALDVCNASHPGISVNAHSSPAIQECLCELSPLACIGYMDVSSHLRQPSVFAVKEDRPPIA